MSFVSILPAYLIWHYSAAYADILRVWTNYIWFFYNFFSISLLAKTLFLPWQRIQEKRRMTLNFEDIAEVVVINTIMRLIGFFIRTIFIVIGSITVLVVFLVGLVFLAVWTFLPILVPVSAIYGFNFLI